MFTSASALVVWWLPEPPEALAKLQAGFSYRLVTGTLLAGLLAFQWSLSGLRTRGYARLAKRMYSWHQVAGALGPLLLLTHSVRAGVGFLGLLCSAFLVNTLLGAFGPTRVAALRQHSNLWFVSHVALSLFVVGLAMYHGWTAMYFE